MTISLAFPPPAGADGALPPEPRLLLARLGDWPFLRIERHGERAVLHGGDRDRVIGTVDVRTGTLTVVAGPELVGPLAARHPDLEVTGRGVRLAVTDARRRAAAEALVRWRIDLERFAPQRREASP
jgi:hypothetical protein